jgi:pimeloyl-ACP methyl ester carboxylesterase
MKMHSILASMALAAAVSVPASAKLDPTLQCRLGAYALSDGRSLAVTGYDGDAHDLRYALSSGEYGHLALGSKGNYVLRALKDEPYGSVSFSDCATGGVTFREAGNPARAGRRIPLPTTVTNFESNGTPLFGKLVMPPAGKAGAIVVWVEGSNDDPSTDDADWQYVLPLKGIGVFVYDKRDTGRSQGEISADFYVRAADTVAALKEAQRLAPQVKSFGVFGGSQGGWVAPLTATLTPLDFVVVGYSLAEGVTAQDRDEVEEEVHAAGYGDDVVPKVREITDATTRIVKSGWKSGYKELAAVERKYSREPWFKAMTSENGYTGVMLKTPLDQIRIMGPKLDRHVSFNYDPQPVIASIRPRQLWVLGAADRTAPNMKTIEILRRIQAHRRDLDLAIYGHADHGIVETFERDGIARHRHPAGLPDLISRWILSDALPVADDDLTIMRSAGQAN